MSIPEMIGVKQLHKDLKKISQRTLRGESFIVMKHTKPLFLLIPYEKNEEEKPYTLKDFARLQRKTGEKNLSKQIDRIIYGI